MKILRNPHTWTILRGISKELMLDGIDERTSTIIPAILAFGEDLQKIEWLLRLNGFLAEVSDEEIEMAKEWIDTNDELCNFLRRGIAGSESFSDLPKLSSEELYFLRYIISRELFICIPKGESEIYMRLLRYLKDKELLIHVFSDLPESELNELIKGLEEGGFEYTIYPALTPLPYFMIDCHGVGTVSESEIYLTSNQKSIVSAYDHIRSVYTFSKPYKLSDRGLGYTNYLSLHYAYMEGRSKDKGTLWGFQLGSGEIFSLQAHIFGISDIRFIKNLHIFAKKEGLPTILRVGGYGAINEDLEFLGIAFQ